MTRRMIGLIGAIALALIGTIAIVAYVNSAENRALEGQEMVKVLVVQEEVPAGTPASELGDRVKLEKVSKNLVADGAVTKVSSLGNYVAAVHLLSGEQVVERRFVAPSVYRAKGVVVAIPDGLLQTTIALDPERAVGGALIPGGTVALTVSIKPDAGELQTSMMLHKVLITNVQIESRDSTQTTTEEPESDSESVEPGVAPTGRFLVTLALDPMASARVIFAAEYGSIWLSIEPRSASDAPTRIVTATNVYQ